jgi:phospholipase/carboxylesterase
MRRLLALALLLPFACEARAPEPGVTQPSSAPEPRAEAAPEPVDTANPEFVEPPEPDLPAVAGVHYLEFVTGDADPNAALPMIIAIHGLGDTPEGFAGLLSGFDRPARVILPRALDPYEPGWSWFPIRARDADVEGLAAGIARAATILAPAIAELSEQRPTRGKPIVTGFSQGGMLAFTLAVHHGELFAAAFPVGGWLPPPLWPAAKPGTDPKLAPPILALHGEADSAVKHGPTAEAVEQLRRTGYAVELRSYAKVGHTIPEAMHADLLAGLREALAKLDSD